MRRAFDWKVFVLIGIILSVAVGFLYGTGILGGDTKNPGSSNDPLVSQSYADQALNQHLEEMSSRIKSLETKVQALESELELLNGLTTDPGSGAGAGTPGGATGGTPGAGTSSTTASQANVGKAGNVNGPVVNLRESASREATILRRLTPTDTFTITKADRDWYQVQLGDGTIGWVAAYLVDVR